MSEWNTGSQLRPPEPAYPSTLTGTPTDPTVSYTFSAGMDMAGFILGEFCVTLSGTVPTSVEFKRQWADTANGTYTDEEAEGLSPGAVLNQKQVGTLEDSAGAPSNGTYRIRVERWSRRFCRLALKRTGGGAGTLAVATFTKAKE